MSAGDVVKIAAVFDSGQEAKSSTFTIVRQYYGQVFGQEAAKAVEPLTEMDFSYGEGETEFSLDYTVPAQDDDEFDFETHNIITITITSLNDLDLASFTDVVLEFK